jgi:hypothetical protein
MRISDATEHTSSSAWGGALAFANIGLPGDAFTGSKWAKTHRPGLLTEFIELLQYSSDVVGLCLNEVGNLDDLLSEEAKKIFEGLIQEAFETAGSAERGPAKIFWPKGGGETVTAWRADMVVIPMSTLKNMPKQPPYRVVERLLLIGATEHGQCSLLVYNQHQPAS